ncbi:hypothetical protein Tco_0937917 [Tanacetum coccineum]|uniref:Uncharacterized protein n=1 Tax=Tanacetum coccineum TaxID=301880 RepID=A0ABQ5DGC7_9ASTR
MVYLTRNPSSYYVTHLRLWCDYEDEYQQDDVIPISEESSSICNGLFEPRLQETLQLFNATTVVEKDIMLGIVQSQENDFLFADAFKMEEIEELSANICLMARIQPADNTFDAGPSYDSAFIRVRVLENINGDNNYLNEFLEADKRAKHFSQQAQSQFVRDRDIIRDLEKQQDKLGLDVKDYKWKNEELQKTHSSLKRQMSENEDIYHDTVLDLEAKLKKNVDLIFKLGNSLQGMFMLGPKSLSVYDQKLKHDLDNEDTLDDASKSQQKIKERDNVKLEYQKLFNSIKKTQSQTQTEMDELIAHVSDNFFANYKLNVHSKVRRTLSIKSRTPKSYDTTYVVHKTRFSKESTLSKSLDTTYVVSKPKIDVGSTSNANDKVSSTKKRNLRDNFSNIYMKNKIRISRIWKRWFESQPNVVWSPINTTPNVHNSRSYEKSSGSVKKWAVKLPTCQCVGSSCVAGSPDRSVDF